MNDEPIIIITTEDVTPHTLEMAETVFEGWFDYDNEPIDWWQFWDRLEKFGYTITDVASPAARKIQRHIRNWRNS